MDINGVFKELAQYKRLEEEAKKEREKLEAEIKAYMDENGLTELLGDEHKALWKEVASTKFDKDGIIERLATLTDTDPKAIKKLYTIANPSKRFTFA